MTRDPTHLPPLPESFAATRAAVHAVAEHVLCVARHDAVGRVGLVAAANGVETPPFGPSDRVVGIDGDEIVDRDRSGERRTSITTVRSAAEFLGVSPGVPAGLWSPVTAFDPDATLPVERRAVRALADWFGFVALALTGLREAGAPTDPSTLWPEGFDLATSGARVNYGGSPGDAFIDGPYLYVGPFDRPFPATEPPFWNAPFGASLRYEDIGSRETAVAFLVRGWRSTRAS